MHKLQNIKIRSFTEEEKRAFKAVKKIAESIPEKFKRLSYSEIELLSNEEKKEFLALRLKLLPTITNYQIDFNPFTSEVEQSIYFSAKNSQKKLEQPDSLQKLEWLERELAAIEHRYFIEKLLDKNHRLINDLKEISQHLNKTIERTKERLQEQKRKSKPKAHASGENWKTMVPNGYRKWLEEVKEEYALTLLKTKVAKAAFLCVVFNKKSFIYPGIKKSLKNDERKFAREFGRSFFGENLTGALQKTDTRKLKNFEDQKIKVEEIFKSKPLS